MTLSRRGQMEISAQLIWTIIVLLAVLALIIVFRGKIFALLG